MEKFILNTPFYPVREYELDCGDYRREVPVFFLHIDRGLLGVFSVMRLENRATRNCEE